MKPTLRTETKVIQYQGQLQVKEVSLADRSQFTTRDATLDDLFLQAWNEGYFLVPKTAVNSVVCSVCDAHRDSCEKRVRALTE